MESLVTSLLSELHNLENELTVLLQINPSPDDSNFETSIDIVESCVDQLRTRLTTIMVTFSKLIDHNRESEPVKLVSGATLSGQEVVISAMSILFLNLFLRISLRFNCNLASASVLLDKLSSDTSERSSIQTMISSLLDKIKEESDD